MVEVDKYESAFGKRYITDKVNLLVNKKCYIVDFDIQTNQKEIEKIASASIDSPYEIALFKNRITLFDKEKTPEIFQKHLNFNSATELEIEPRLEGLQRDNQRIFSETEKENIIASARKEGYIIKPPIIAMMQYELGCGQVPNFDRSLYALSYGVLASSYNQDMKSEKPTKSISLPIPIIASAFYSDKNLNIVEKEILKSALVAEYNIKQNSQLINIGKDETELGKALRLTINTTYKSKKYEDKGISATKSSTYLIHAWDNQYLKEYCQKHNEYNDNKHNEL